MVDAALEAAHWPVSVHNSYALLVLCPCPVLRVSEQLHGRKRIISLPFLFLMFCPLQRPPDTYFAELDEALLDPDVRIHRMFSCILVHLQASSFGGGTFRIQLQGGNLRIGRYCKVAFCLLSKAPVSHASLLCALCLQSTLRTRRFNIRQSIPPRNEPEMECPDVLCVKGLSQRRSLVQWISSDFWSKLTNTSYCHSTNQNRLSSISKIQH